MGIYDRDYYRESTRFNPFAGRVQACIALVVIYVAVFLLQMATREGRRAPGPVYDFLVLNSEKVKEGEVWRVATYAFVHETNSILPILCNILFLIWFGRAIEDLRGWKEFLVFYLLAGLLAGAGFAALSAVTGARGVLIGPQASITAVLLLVALHDPRRTVLLFFVIPTPIWVVLAFHVLVNVSGFATDRLSGLVLFAHCCAAGFTYCYHRFHWQISTWRPRWSGSSRRKTAPRLSIFRGEPETDEPAPRPAAERPAPAGASAGPATATPATASPTMDEQLEAKLDEVLEKVKKYGQESLTEEERSVLFRASEIYRRRRKMGGS